MAIDLGDIPSGTSPSPAEQLQIRKAIGVGQTDAPTFLKVAVSPGAATTDGGVAFGSEFELRSAATNTLMGFWRANQFRALFGGTAIHTCSLGSIGFSDTSTNVAVTDTLLWRDAAGILAQRNGTAAQAFRVYNTFPGTGNNEYGQIAWTSNEFVVGSAISGSGSPRRTILSGNDIVFVASSGARWQITSAGLLAFADNTYDIGASGANRPRDLYVAGQFFLGGTVRASGGFKWNVGGTSFVENANGVVLLQDNAGTSFGRLQLGGTTSAFPAIARSGANIGIVLGDGSGYTSLLCKNAVQNPGVGTTVTPASIGDLVTETTSNTSVTLKLKGSDGTVRSVALTLA